MLLSDLYPADTPMNEVHPEFRGMQLKAWRLQKLHQQSEEYLKSLTGAPIPNWAQRAAATPMDRYGMKGV